MKYLRLKMEPLTPVLNRDTQNEIAIARGIAEHFKRENMLDYSPIYLDCGDIQSEILRFREEKLTSFDSVALFEDETEVSHTAVSAMAEYEMVLFDDALHDGFAVVQTDEKTLLFMGNRANAHYYIIDVTSGTGMHCENPSFGFREYLSKQTAPTFVGFFKYLFKEKHEEGTADPKRSQTGEPLQKKLKI